LRVASNEAHKLIRKEEEMRKEAAAGLLTGALALAALAASATAAPVVSRVTIHKDSAFHGG